VNHWLALKRLVALLVVVWSLQLSAAEVDIQTMKQQAEQGDAWAQLNLGAAYDNGIGVERDIDKALHWYQKAAEQGLAKAQYNLAHLLATEEISTVAAAEWMLKAANQGMADAQYLMGVIYAEGLGVGIDDKKAVFWLKKAIAQGHHEAAVFLKKTYKITAETSAQPE
jgi:TPR repeat protein